MLSGEGLFTRSHCNGLLSGSAPVNLRSGTLSSCTSRLCTSRRKAPPKASCVATHYGFIVLCALVCVELEAARNCALKLSPMLV